MTWEAALPFLGPIALVAVVELFRALSKRGREGREQKGLDVTNDLTVVQARRVAEEVETMKLDRSDRLELKIEALETKLEDLLAEIDVERRDMWRQISKLRAQSAKHRAFAEKLLAAWPTPPPPQVPSDWDEFPVDHRTIHPI